MATQFANDARPALASEMMHGLTLSKGRKPDRRTVTLPQGLRIVSADNHIGLCEDIWYEGFPDHLKDKAPRIVFDSGLWSVRPPDGKPFAEMTELEQQLFRIFETNDIPGNTDLDARMADIEAEGYTQEIVYPQMTGMFYGWPDLEVREWIFRIYNRHLAKLQAEKPGQFYGVGVPIYWDMAKVRDSIQEMKALGIKTMILPRHPGVDVDGNPIHYSGPACKPMWDAIEEAGMPVNFHIGEGGLGGGVNGWAHFVLESLDGFRRNFSEFVFGGIFDRHPSLKVVFVESGINWVATALQDAEMMYDSFTPLFDPLPKKRPSDYWREHCYTVFMVDTIGLKLLDYVGADTVMWAADYPHNESTYGYSGAAIQEVLDHVSEADARKILGDTARALYDLP